MRNRPGDLAFHAINSTLLLLLTLACIYPVLYVLYASVSDPLRLMAFKGVLLSPLGFTLDGYGLVFREPGILRGFTNSLFYVTAATVTNMVFTILGAYVLSRKNLLFRKAITLMILFTMFFGGGLIPFFLLVKDLGMIDRWTSLVFPFAINTWNLIIMRTGFQAVPDAMEESANLDGANDLVILTRIIVPMTKATLAVILLYYAVGNWNSWFPAMVFLRDRDKYPIQLILREILISNDTRSMVSAMGSDLNVTNAYRELVKYCTIVIATLPIMLVYPFIQRHFVKGVFVGSLKG